MIRLLHRIGEWWEQTDDGFRRDINNYIIS